MARIKGSSLLNRLRFLEEKTSVADKTNILAKLSPAFQSEISNHSILSVRWYPLNYLTQLLNAIHEVMDKDKNAYDAVRQAANFTATITLRGIYKIFFRLSTPDFLFSRINIIWPQIYDCGTLDSKMIGPKTARLQVKDFPEMNMAFCYSVQGWIEGSLSLCRLSKMQVSITQFPTPSENACEIISTWE